MLQRTAQVDRVVGFAQGAAVGLAVHLDAAGAIMGEPIEPILVGGQRRRHLEHRTHAESGERPVDQ